MHQYKYVPIFYANSIFTVVYSHYSLLPFNRSLSKFACL